MKINGDVLSDFNRVSRLEWLETNGLGGYASGTVSGAHSRKYHGILIAAMHPPVGRMVVVSKLDETIVTAGRQHALSSNQYPGVVHPAGFRLLKVFERDLFPVFYYQAGDVEIKKTIAAVHGENTTLVLYEVIKAPKAFVLTLQSFYACRDLHSLAQANTYISQEYHFDQGIFRSKNYEGCPAFFISVQGSKFMEQKEWYYNFEYEVERSRGLNFREDLYTHGKFTVELKAGARLGVILSTEDPTGKDAFELLAAERTRREGVTKEFTKHDYLKRLVLAADQFIVKRGELNTIVAGYHWFSDWGRDTMISLPGLCLVTKRYPEAKKILQAFAAYIDNGMLPNRFPDSSEKPEYNTIDATLWFFHAIYKYYIYTEDKVFIQSLLPALEDSIRWHYKGTRYNIQVDPEDELLYGGQDGVQLTWMDAKVEDWVVTPRRGKAVEVNALWYNALRIMETLMAAVESQEGSVYYRVKADKVFASFNEKFWNEAQECLYDFIDKDQKNDDLRPNQLFAISLPFRLLTKDKAEKVYHAVANDLLTSRGLRSLSPRHKGYKPAYSGGIWSRDGAYHQGTVWSFLIGPFIDALMYVTEGRGRAEASGILNGFLEHLDEECVGSISEIFDGGIPHTPRGCIAQAWGVAEVLRAGVEHNLIE